MANATLDDQIEDLELEDDGSTIDEPTDNEDRGNDFEPTEDDKTSEPAAEEPAQEEDDGRKNGSRMVPITRFNEVNERMKELAAQNQQLLDAITRGTPQQAQPEAPKPEAVTDLKELRVKHYAALTEGRDDEAIELQGQIDAAIEERAMQRAMAQMTASQAQREQAAQLQTFQQVVQEIERSYPQLNVNSDEANEDAILYVVAKRDALIKSGESMADALKQASDAAARMFGFGGEQPAHIAKPANENRKQEALLRNAKAAQAQPPQTNGLGNRATAPQRLDVSSMNEAEFEALPESEKARLRGD